MAISIDTIVQALLRRRMQLIATAATIARDVDAADDIFQQVVLAALQHAAEIRDEVHLLAWAGRVARQRAVDYARRKKAKTLSSDVLDLLEATWGDPADGAPSDHVEALRRCVGKLEEPARELLRLKYHEGLSTPDLTSRLHRSAEALYQALSRIHRALRHCIHRELAGSCETTATSDAWKTSSPVTGTRP